MMVKLSRQSLQISSLGKWYVFLVQSDKILTLQIIVRSSEAATESLQTFFSSMSITHDLYAPRLGQEIKIGEHVKSYSINLGDSLTGMLDKKWSKVRDILSWGGTH